MEFDSNKMGSVYSPGETTLVNAAKNGYTRYIGGPTEDGSEERSIFYNTIGGRYNNGPAELRVYQLDLFYKLLADESFFEEFMDLQGEILGSYTLDEYGGGHGTIIVDTLTYGFESADISADEATNRDDWLTGFINTELASIDSTKLPPLGIAYRARLEERLASINDDTSDPSFAVTVEEYSDGFDLAQL